MTWQKSKIWYGMDMILAIMHNIQWRNSSSLFLCVINTVFSKPWFRFCVLGMTLNCIHTEWCPGHDVKLHPHFIVTGSFLYWCVMRPVSQRFFIHSCIYLRILIVSYLATFLGTNSLSVLMCRKAVSQSIDLGSIWSMCGVRSIWRRPCAPLKQFLSISIMGKLLFCRGPFMWLSILQLCLGDRLCYAGPLIVRGRQVALMHRRALNRHWLQRLISDAVSQCH